MNLKKSKMRTVAIFMHGQNGDIMEAMGFLKYLDALEYMDTWGKCRIVWYASMENWDIFKHQDIEVREFPRGFGYPEMVVEENRKLIEKGEAPVWEDWKPLVDENNHLNLELKKNYPSLNDIDYGYFPAPHQVPANKREGIEYGLVAKKVYGIPDKWPWHPVLKFSDQERQDAVDFMNGLLYYTKTVAIESFAGSGQSAMNDANIREAMRLCREILGPCNFIFVSHKYLRTQEQFPEDILNQDGVYSAKQFTVRQCALVVGKCDLLISVSSGISVASSCWDNKATPIIQYCGSRICSTQAIALGRFELADSEINFYLRLTQLLNDIK